MVTYPTIEKDTLSSTPQILWQARKINISYSLLHPLSISANLDGEQIFCTLDDTNHCFQLHGKPWNIHIPILGNNLQNSIYLQCKEVIYTNSLQSTDAIRSIRFKNIHSKLHWNILANQQTSLFFLDLNIQKIFVNFVTFSTQELRNIHLQTSLIQEPNDLYKLLVQNANVTWNRLSINSAGKLLLPFSKMTPTGELSLYLTGVNQAIYQQLSSWACCIKLQKELSQTSLPSQIHLTLFIRDGVFYLGAIPLQARWYNDLKLLMSRYAK